jgi:hypothetical protein
MRTALAESLHRAFFMGIGIAVLALIVAFFFPPGSAQELARQREQPDF